MGPSHTHRLREIGVSSSTVYLGVDPYGFHSDRPNSALCVITADDVQVADHMLDELYRLSSCAASLCYCNVMERTGINLGGFGSFQLARVSLTSGIKLHT